MRTKCVTKKRKAKKRIAVVVLCVLLTLAFLPSIVFADEAVHLQAEGEVAEEQSKVETIEAENAKDAGENPAEGVITLNEILDCETSELTEEEDEPDADLIKEPEAVTEEMLDQAEDENSAADETETFAEPQNTSAVLADETEEETGLNDGTARVSDTIPADSYEALDRVENAIKAAQADPKPQIPIAIYAQGKDASQETIDEIWDQAFDWARERLAQLQSKYSAAENNATACAMDVYISTFIRETGTEEPPKSDMNPFC